MTKLEKLKFAHDTADAAYGAARAAYYTADRDAATWRAVNEVEHAAYEAAAAAYGAYNAELKK